MSTSDKENYDKVVLPAIQIPSWRVMKAIERGNANRLLFTTWGGLGDQICAEPTLRFAIDTFKKDGCEVHLATDFPELFQHLEFDSVINLKESRPVWEDYLVMHTITTPESLTWEFASHCVTHCVDFPTLCSTRSTLPISYKNVVLKPEVDETRAWELSGYLHPNFVAVHPGAHWETKTFPASWWNAVLSGLKREGFTPVIIGVPPNGDGTTVDVDTEGCVDLRGKTTIMESVWMLQAMHYLITNDSSPLHMAASGDAHIAYLATAKHQDYIQHWRFNGVKNEWGWRQKHFNKSGIWNHVNHCPNVDETVTVDKIDQETLMSWLCEPEEIVEWICQIRSSLPQ